MRESSCPVCDEWIGIIKIQSETGKLEYYAWCKGCKAAFDVNITGVLTKRR